MAFIESDTIAMPENELRNLVRYIISEGFPDKVLWDGKDYPLAFIHPDSVTDEGYTEGKEIGELYFTIGHGEFSYTKALRVFKANYDDAYRVAYG